MPHRGAVSTSRRDNGRQLLLIRPLPKYHLFTGTWHRILNAIGAAARARSAPSPKHSTARPIRSTRSSADTILGRGWVVGQFEIRRRNKGDSRGLVPAMPNDEAERYRKIGRELRDRAQRFDTDIKAGLLAIADQWQRLKRPKEAVQAEGSRSGGPTTRDWRCWPRSPIGP